MAENSKPTFSYTLTPTEVFSAATGKREAGFSVNYKAKGVRGSKTFLLSVGELSDVSTLDANVRKAIEAHHSTAK